MKHLLFAMIAISIVTSSQLLFADASESSNLESQIKPGQSTSGGRFQLFQGLFTVNFQGKPVRDAGVFKIDSTTGRAWKYSEGMTKDGVLFQKWSPID